MKRLRFLPLVSLVLFVFTGCGHHQAGTAVPQQTEVAEEPAIEVQEMPALAQRLEGWNGVNNLFSEGDVYFGGQPDSASFVRLAQELDMATIVTLKRPEELGQLSFDQPGLITELGMSFVQIPISGASLSKEHALALKEALDGTDGPVLIHCGSSNRVGATWAIHLIVNEGLGVEEALERGRAAGLRAESLVEAVRRIAAEK